MMYVRRRGEIVVDTFVALDIETTGLSPDKDKIIEIGALKVIKGQIVDQFSRLINPGIKLPDRIVEITGIQDDMLVEEEGEDQVIPQFIDFLEDNILLGHNILFDYSFIKAYMAKRRLTFVKQGIDTLTLSRALHSGLRSRSLASMCHYYGIHNPNAHRAFEDAKAASSLYFKMVEEFGEEKSEIFKVKELIYKPPKNQTITNKQKNYLLDLIKYHKINTQSVLNEVSSIDDLTKSQASRLIDKIILNHGRIL